MAILAAPLGVLLIQMVFLSNWQIPKVMFHALKEKIIGIMGIRTVYLLEIIFYNLNNAQITNGHVPMADLGLP
jgi:hypothetical protein